MRDAARIMLTLADDEAAWLEAQHAMHQYTALHALGIELVAINADEIVLEMEISDASRQPYGLLHGGISMVLAESAASMHACWGVDLRERIPVGIEINGSHLASADSGRVRATGRVLRRSRRTIVHEIELRHIESTRLLNVSRVTNLYRSPPK